MWYITLSPDNSKSAATVLNKEQRRWLYHACSPFSQCHYISTNCLPRPYNVAACYPGYKTLHWTAVIQVVVIPVYSVIYLQVSRNSQPEGSPPWLLFPSNHHGKIMSQLIWLDIRKIKLKCLNSVRSERFFRNTRFPGRVRWAQHASCPQTTPGKASDCNKCFVSDPESSRSPNCFFCPTDPSRTQRLFITNDKETLHLSCKQQMFAKKDWKIHELSNELTADTLFTD